MSFKIFGVLPFYFADPVLGFVLFYFVFVFLETALGSMNLLCGKHIFQTSIFNRVMTLRFDLDTKIAFAPCK